MLACPRMMMQVVVRADIILSGLVLCRHLVRLTLRHEVKYVQLVESENHTEQPHFSAMSIPILYSRLSISI
jgi:hypothetical protein